MSVMHPIRSLQRVIVMAAAAGVFGLGVPHVIPGVAANAAFGPFWAGAGYSPDTNTTTATCGNGLIALGPIVLPVAPFTTTVIQCEKTSSDKAPRHQEVVA